MPKFTPVSTGYKAFVASQHDGKTVHELKSEWKSLSPEEKKKYKEVTQEQNRTNLSLLKKLLKKPIIKLSIPVSSPRQKYLHAQYAQVQETMPGKSIEEITEAVFAEYDKLQPRQRSKYSLIGEKFIRVTLDKGIVEEGLQDLDKYIPKAKRHPFNSYIHENFSKASGDTSADKMKQLADQFSRLSDQEKEEYQEKADKYNASLLKVSPVEYEKQLLVVCAHFKEEYGENWLTKRVSIRKQHKSGYNIFYAEEYRKNHSGKKVGEFGSAISDAWRELSQEQKQAYNEQARKLAGKE